MVIYDDQVKVELYFKDESDNLLVSVEGLIRFVTPYNGFI